jgi:DNA invertase Pin-like site-specific DNA recombinase
MAASNDLIDSSLPQETISALRACWERWSASLPLDARNRPHAAAYLRSDPTAAGALVDQLEHVLRALSASGYFVPWELVAAEAVSGYKRDSREKLQRLVALAGTRRFTSLGVYDLPRLGRDLRQVVALIEGLFDSGVDVTRPGMASMRSQGHLLSTLKVMSEMLEVAQLRDRATRSHRRRQL